MKTRTYGTTTQAEIAGECAAQYPNGYRIECPGYSDDFTVIQAAVNIGIDSHLEAVEFTEFKGSYGKRGFNFTPEGLSVLCRRLAESDEENANDLRGCILETLGIEEV